MNTHSVAARAPSEILQAGEAIRLDGATFPQRAQFSYITHKGVRLRVLVLPSNAVEARGTIILVPGRTEFIEKYFETAESFRARGYAVLLMDHRGQGLSDRLLPDPLKSWVGSFDHYVDDLAFMVKTLEADLPRPHIIVGQSMGGAIALLGLISGHLDPDAAVINCPMLALYGLDTPPLTLTVSILSHLGFSRRRLPFQPANEGIPVPFKGNKLTSDKTRYTRWRAYFDNAPRLRIAGPTYGWIRAADKAMRTIRRNAKKLKTPTLIVQTSMDTIVIPSAVKEFAHMANTDFKMIKGARHETFLEQDQYRNQFFESFDDFCKKNAL
ncbi:MAG: alpha/beta hydrolase [Robiginitomaculum sp.]